MVTTAELGLDLDPDCGSGHGRLPLDEDAVRATYSRFELHVPTAIRGLTLREPTRTVSSRTLTPLVRGAAAQGGAAAQADPAPTGPAYVQECLF